MLGRLQSGVLAVKIKAPTPAGAAAELARLLPGKGLAMVVVFLSSYYDPHRFASEMAVHFVGTPVFGCTTAGEIALDGWDDNSAVALGFCAAYFEVTAHTFSGLSDLHIEDRHRIDGDRRLLSLGGNEDNERCFGLVLIDGTCQREEIVLSAIHAALGHIPIVGGSAGDVLRFGRSRILFGGCAHSDAAVLLVVKTSLPFRTFSSDNCRPGTAKMVVTKADPSRRIVQELNAEPAAFEYSRLSGIASQALDLAALASHPLVVRVGDRYYARSIRRVDSDGALHFACAIDEGLVLTAAKPSDPVSPTRERFVQIRNEIGEVSIYIGFEFIYRRIGAEQHQRDLEISDLYRSHRVFGCSTYGELYGAIHLNQTLTGVAIGTPEL